MLFRSRVAAAALGTVAGSGWRRARRWTARVFGFVLPLFLASLATPAALARDSGPNPWEVVGELLRQSGKPAADPRRPRATVSKVEAAELWDAFLTRIVKHAAGESEDAARRQQFLLVLLSGRYDGVALLASEAPLPEPLRELFLLSWDRLAPELRQLAKELDSQAAKSLRALVEAGDALRAAQALSEAIGVQVTPQVLRELARLDRKSTRLNSSH